MDAFKLYDIKTFKIYQNEIYSSKIIKNILQGRTNGHDKAASEMSSFHFPFLFLDQSNSLTNIALLPLIIIIIAQYIMTIKLS